MLDAPLKRNDTNNFQYHFLRRWLVFLVHSCVLFLFAYREGSINLYKKSKTGGVLPPKILSVSLVRGERASRVVSP